MLAGPLGLGRLIEPFANCVNVPPDGVQWDKEARKRTGVTHPARLSDQYGKKPRLWNIGTIDDTGRADTELRLPYHLIAKGKAIVTEADVIALGQMTDAQLGLLLPWPAHRLILAEWIARF